MQFLSQHFSSIVRKIGIWSLVILGIVVCTGIAYLYGPSIPTWIRTISVASSAHFLAGGGETRALYKMGIFAPEKQHFSVPGKIVDYAKQGNVEVGVVLATDGTEDLYILSATPEKITSDGGVKGYPSISPDGKHIVFASLTVPQGQPVVQTILASAIEDWNLVVLDRQTKQTRTLVHGYAPQFFTQRSKEHLFFMTNNGFGITNTEGIVEGHATTTENKQKILYPSIISSDGTRVALYNTQFNFIELFTTDFTATSSVVLTSTGRLPQGAYAAAFSGNDVYSLMKLGDRTAGMRVAPVDRPFQKTIIRVFGVENFPYRLSI